jgi:hypothetical protein
MIFVRFFFVFIASVALFATPASTEPRQCAEELALLERSIENGRTHVRKGVSEDEMNRALCLLSTAKRAAQDIDLELNYDFHLNIQRLGRSMNWSPRSILMSLKFEDIYFVESGAGLRNGPRSIEFTFMPNGPGTAHEYFKVRLVPSYGEGIHELRIINAITNPAPPPPTPTKSEE